MLKLGARTTASRPLTASTCAAAPPSTAPARADFQHSNEEIRAGVSAQYSRQWEGCLQFSKLQQYLVSSEQLFTGRKWGRVGSFTIYVLQMAVRIY